MCFDVQQIISFLISVIFKYILLLLLSKASWFWAYRITSSVWKIAKSYLWSKNNTEGFSLKSTFSEEIQYALKSLFIYFKSEGNRKVEIWTFAFEFVDQVNTQSYSYIFEGKKSQQWKYRFLWLMVLSGPRVKQGNDQIFISFWISNYSLWVHLYIGIHFLHKIPSHLLSQSAKGSQGCLTWWIFHFWWLVQINKSYSHMPGHVQLTFMSYLENTPTWC